jgi:hypothetical protein
MTYLQVNVRAGFPNFGSSNSYGKAQIGAEYVSELIQATKL